MIKEIDYVHHSANLALKNKDFIGYINHFSDHLKYKQLNGKTINKEILANDISVYFSRVQNYTSHYDRINFSINKENDIFVERLKQQANVSIKVFFFFSKKWIVEREGIYTWQKINGSWKIIEVEVISEKVY